MSEVKRETLELLDMMPKVNSATPYGSGYFKQNDGNGEKKSMDIILSVDNPNEWHKENHEMNAWMYSGSGKHHLINNCLDEEEVKFPHSLGCFFTDFEGREYKFVVVDKRLLYSHLTTWEHFSLAGRFQKEMVLLIDNSDGILPELMEMNYKNAVKVGLLMNPERAISEQRLFETITSLSYLGDLRNIFHMEDPNKISNIVEGSYDFFKRVYGNQDSEYIRENGLIYKNRGYYQDVLASKIDTLPTSLRRYLFKKLEYLDEYDYDEVAYFIRKYFKKMDFADSIKMALRCNQTVGIKKVGQTLSGKFKKGRQKVKK